MEGSVIWIACIGQVEHDAEGRPARMYGVNIDITARRGVQERLRQSELQFRTISNAAPAMVWVADPEGRFLFINDRWFEYTGQSREGKLGAGWQAYVHPADLEQLEMRWQQCMRSGEAYEGEARYRSAPGEFRWHAYRALPVRNAAGAIEQWIGCSVDVHDARQAQESLREADRRKDEFLATLAHELRNPLAPIRNSLWLLSQRLSNEPTLRAAQQMMDRQVEHMVRLIDDLLDVNRITRGSLELRRQPVELATVVEQALETSRPHITQQLTVALPSEPVHLDADPVRLAQVFSNLLNNAAKFTPRSGQIALKAVREGGEVAVSVRDSGMGMAPEQLPQLFQMFSQFGKALDPSKGGLGIGLALARSLVELHGGSIGARSDGPGRGSEFTVRLPVLQMPQPAEPAPAAPVAYSGAVRRVLVVDDAVDNVESLATLLRLDGHTVETAADGLEAVAKALAFKPDLILLDLGLPHLDGYAACRLIRRQPLGKAVVIVALTGWGQDSDRQRALQAGFDSHLVKPVSYGAVRNILASPLMA